MFNNSNSKAEKKQIFNLFIEQYFGFLKFIKEYSKNNLDFNKFYTKNLFLKKTNIKLFIKTWYRYITQNYYQPIMNGDVDFFLSKNDYDNNDTKLLNSEYNFIKYINHLKQVYNSIEDNISKIFVEHIQKLTQLSFLYYK